ncbi:hypothetical protein FKP32DRAFT_1587535 [Trametes sanguinea]|nr:hypothetical protein FKP32DRAFT_1587535 [Trametes sanguinea]
MSCHSSPEVIHHHVLDADCAWSVLLSGASGCPGVLVLLLAPDMRIRRHYPLRCVQAVRVIAIPHVKRSKDRQQQDQPVSGPLRKSPDAACSRRTGERAAVTHNVPTYRETTSFATH